jgi:multidrug efflux pump subunit AcrB/outer membrane protein TolC
MEKLVRFFVDRPLMTNIFVIIFLAIALTTLSGLQKEGFPNVALNKVSIQTVYPGASAMDIEANVTIPIEEAIESVSGVTDVTSKSRENLSVVEITADDNASKAEFDRIFNDLKQAIDGIDDLPNEIDGRPVITQIRTQDQPILEVAISGPADELNIFVPKLETKLRRLNKVSQIHRLGLPDDEVNVKIDLEKAKKYNVDLRMVASAIKNRNQEGSAGSIDRFSNSQKVVVNNKLSDPKDVLNTVLRMSSDGHGVKLSQIATVDVAPKDTKMVVRNNGAKGVTLLVVKKGTADIIKTIDDVEESISNIAKPDSITIALMNDKSALTKNRLKLLSSNAGLGFSLVILLLFIVFGLNTAIWTAFGIPFSILGAVILLPALDSTFNALSIGACVLVLGLLVDDAIVVAEQINSLRKKGMSGPAAAAKGVSMIWKPVIASAITTVIAFSPLTQMGGMPGKFIWILPAVVMLALIFSLFESFFVLPVHLAHGKIRKEKKNNLGQKLEAGYRIALSKALSYRYLILPLFIAIFVSALFIAAKYLPKEPFPQQGAESFSYELILKEGSGIEHTEQEVRKIETLLLELPKNEVQGITARIGSKNINQKIDRGTLENEAVIIVYLTPYSKRTRTASELMALIQSKSSKILEPETNIRSELKRLGPPVGKAFEVEISGNDESLRTEKVMEVREYLKGHKAVLDIGDDVVRGKQEVNLKFNESMLAQADLSVSDVLTTYRIALDGIIVTTVANVNGSLDYRVRLTEQDRADIETLKSLPVINKRGQQINISRMLTIEKNPSVGEQIHLNGERTNTVFGNINKELTTPLLLAKELKEKFPSDENISIGIAGESEDNSEIFGSLFEAALLALLGTYLVIAIILNSLSKPFIVMSVIPFAAVGVIYTLFVADMAISMFAMISLIGLMGIIVNGSILMLYTISGESEASFKDQIIAGASQRLRPILLTTATTFLGLVPTGYGVGGYDPFISPMCLTMAYGLIFGTFVLLFLVPSLTMFGRDIGNMKSKILGKLGRKAIATGAIFLISILGTLPSSQVQAEPEATLKLSDIPDLVKHNYSHQQYEEATVEAKANVGEVDAPFDSKFTISPQTQSSKSKADVFNGFSGEQQTDMNSIRFGHKKMFRNGFAISSELKFGESTFNPGEATTAQTQAMTAESDEFESKQMELGLNASIPLAANFLGEQFDVHKKIKLQSVSLSEQQLKKANQNITYQLTNLYWQVYLARVGVNVSQSTYNNSKVIRKTNSLKLKNGMISKSQYLLIDLNVKSKLNDLEEAKTTYRTAIQNLNQEIPNRSFASVSINVPKNLNSLRYHFKKDDKNSSSIDLKNIQLQEDLINSQLSLYRMEQRQKVDLILSAKLSGSGEEFSDASDEISDQTKPTYLAGINWTIQPRHSDRLSKSLSASSKLSQLGHQRNALHRKLNTTYQVSLDQFNTYLTILENLKEIKKQRRELLKAQEIEFRQGRVSTKDYLDAQTLLDTTTIQQAQVMVKSQRILLNYLNSVGRIDDYFKK